MRRQWEETRSEASRSCSKGEAEDYRRSLVTNQSRSLLPYRRVHPSSESGRASQKSGVSKSYPQRPSRQPTTACTARSTVVGGTGAGHKIGGGTKVSSSRFGVKQGEVTFNNSLKGGEGKELTVNQIQHVMQRMDLGEEGKSSSVNEDNEVDQGMQDMSID